MPISRGTDKQAVVVRVGVYSAMKRSEPWISARSPHVWNVQKRLIYRDGRMSDFFWLEVGTENVADGHKGS